MCAGLAAHHLDESPGDELLQLAEGLLLEDVAHLPLPRTLTLAQDEISHRPETGSGWVEPFLIERFVMLDRRQPRQLFARQSQHAAHFVVEVGSIGEGRELLASQQLGDVRLRHFSAVGEIALIETELFQAAADHEREIHDLTKMIIQ
jgi:hypothetical protein